MNTYWNDILRDNFSLKGVGWANWPESYNLILYKKYLKGFDKVISELGSKHGFNVGESTRVLEIGPGVGFYTRYLKGKGVRDYEALDISRSSVENLGRSFPEYRFRQADVSAPEALGEEQKGKYDLTVIIDVLLHITNPENQRNAVKNLSESLKPGGFLLSGDAVTVLRKDKIPASEVSPHNRITDIESVKKLFSENGLELQGIYQRYNFLLNENFDFKHPLSQKLSGGFFWLINGSLTLFKGSEFYGKLIGYPLSFLDSIITPLQEQSRNCKFLLFKKIK